MVLVSGSSSDDEAENQINRSAYFVSSFCSFCGVVPVGVEAVELTVPR